MNPRSIFFIFLFFFSVNISFSQNANLSHINKALSDHICDSIDISISPEGIDTSSSSLFKISFTGTNLLAKSYTTKVSWGDGNTDSYTGTSVKNNTEIVWSSGIEHSYSNPNNSYNISVVITESVSKDSVKSTFSIGMKRCKDFAINLITDLDCDNNDTIESSNSFWFWMNSTSLYVYDSNDTIYPSIQVSNTYFWPDSLSGTYTVEYSKKFLDQMNVTVDTIYLSSITFPTSATTVDTVNSVLNCIPDTLCIKGYVFCDSNSNGIFDSTEIAVSNALVDMTTQSMTNIGTSPLLITTDSLGFYDTTWVSFDSIYFNLNINQAWLDSNKYGNPNLISYFNDWQNTKYFNCDSSFNFNIPIDCNPTSTDSICFEGIVYIDSNYNGVMDNNEKGLDSIPINVYGGGLTYIPTIYTDTAGFYSYSGYSPKANSVYISISNWWLNNNGYSNLSGTSLPYFKCDSSNVHNIGLMIPTNFKFGTVLYAPYQLNSPYSCDTVKMSVSPSGIDSSNLQHKNYYFTGTDILNKNFTITINWGDSTTTTHSGTSISNNTAIVWTPAIEHVYSSTGNHSVLISIKETSSQTSLTLSRYFITGYCDNYRLVMLQDIDCNADSIIENSSFGYNSIYNTYIYNSTDTIRPILQSQSTFYWPDTLSGTYTIGFDSPLGNWNYTVASSNPSQITFPNSGSIDTIVSILNCIPDTICISGYVYCDSNSNGIFDSTELGMSNAIISISTDTLNNLTSFPLIITTDSLGFYDTTWVNYDTIAYTMTLSQAWLDSNNYIASKKSFNFSQWYNNLYFNCDSLVDFNIPIICNLDVRDSICFDGIIYIDSNYNGNYENNESTIANVPLTFYLDGVYTVTIYSDSNGYYSYSGYHPNSFDRVIQINSNWLNNNNFNAFTIMLDSTACDSAHVHNFGLTHPSNFNFSYLKPASYWSAPDYCDTARISISPYGIDSTNFKDVNVYFLGTGLLNKQYKASINWGDGSTSTHTGSSTTSSTAIVWTPLIEHVYSGTSINVISFKLEELYTKKTSVTLSILTYSGACKSKVINTKYVYDCELDGNIDSIGKHNAGKAFILENLNNTYTPLFINDYDGVTYWPNMDTGTYQIKIDSVEFAKQFSRFNNGYWIKSISPSTFTVPDTSSTRPLITVEIACVDSICYKGYIYCDENLNGIMDSTETGHANVPLTITSTNYSTSITTDSTGHYSAQGFDFIGDTTTIQIDQAWIDSTGYLNVTTTHTIHNLNYVCSGSGSASYNMPMHCDTVTCTNLWTTIVPDSGYYQNFNNTIKLNWGYNSFVGPGNYSVTLDYPSNATLNLSSINNSSYTTGTNTITWNLSSSNKSGSFSETLEFTLPTGIADSTFHTYSASVTLTDSTECDTLDNTTSLGMYVGVSYDPNDKSVNKPLYVNPAIQDEYTYVVRFQNTGTAPAQDVYIIDTLSQNLDWTTLEVLEATHPMQLVNFGNGLIKFDFSQIWLPDSVTNEPASHGHIVYRIKENSNLSNGDIIENTAYIYFDQNAPIITNTTRNINLSLSISKFSQTTIKLYPNPSNGKFTIESNETINQINVFDMTGNLITNISSSAKRETIDLNNLSQGLYQVQIITNHGITAMSIIIE